MSADEPYLNKPPSQRDDALAVVRRLRDSGHIAYFAGGCVRDLLLKITPKDYDVATDAPPQRVRELFSNTQAVGAAFGVILVKHRKSTIEVATFRTEGAYLDGRRPSAVRFTTAEEDARRRDFTINGLFLDPIDDRVIDHVAGRDDLAARRIRAIGNPDARFAEDHLRLLRAVRFAARLGFTVEPGTADAVRRHAPSLVRISPERIADELRRMLTPLTRLDAWRMLWDFALVDQLFRFLNDSPPDEFDPARSLFLALAPDQTIPFGLALAVATLDYRLQSAGRATDVRTLLTPPQISRITRAMRQALKISNQESDELVGTLEPLAILLADTPPTLAQKRRFLARPAAPLTLLLLDALARIDQHPGRIAALRPDLLALAQHDNAPPPLLTGDDLTPTGLKPGPIYKRILDTVYDAQLEGRITSKDQALTLARTLAKPPGDRPADPS